MSKVRGQKGVKVVRREEAIEVEEIVLQEKEKKL